MAGDKDGKMDKYMLYLMANNKENMEIVKNERYYRAKGRYILVYTNKLLGVLPSTHYHIINESEIGHLSDSEKVWLLEANIQIIAEETARKQEEILNSFGDRIERLERELEIESEKIGKGQDSSDEQ